MPYTNEDIIDALYRLYEQPMYFEAYKILHDEYLAEDAVHEAFLNGRKACMGIWNSMYLSRPETRCLMHRAAHKNYVYHMPECQDDMSGIWRKCRNNLQRYPDELRDIVIMDRYPYVI